jgi:hypothetical protein
MVPYLQRMAEEAVAAVVVVVGSIYNQKSMISI